MRMFFVRTGIDAMQIEHPTRKCPPGILAIPYAREPPAQEQKKLKPMLSVAGSSPSIVVARIPPSALASYTLPSSAE